MTTGIFFAAFLAWLLRVQEHGFCKPSFQNNRSLLSRQALRHPHQANLTSFEVWKDVEPGQLAAEFQKDCSQNTSYNSYTKTPVVSNRIWQCPSNQHSSPSTSSTDPGNLCRIHLRGPRIMVRSCRSWRKTFSPELSVPLANMANVELI